ncbi:hypothetical protein DS2_14759 [Catenovulum agarivorans DS-2]|uniref:DoxX family protein n=1 Tax=Catenovulum agarivorans DS-2 TaxID=1328313 RepID=W7Q822_9ALTE|nr:hypothetical protein [Catenovulum agarivorans]EWH08954.1 hypothetical protein DS2_14759 [Catenovulum agarivorans DS-2]
MVNKDIAKSLITSFQVLLAVIYFSAGMSKLVPDFPNIIGPVWLIDELSKYQLALFGYFIAVSQLLVGLLLFFNKFRLVASLMLLPMHLSITIIPISLGWQGTPYVNGVLLLMILAILYSEKARLMALVGQAAGEKSQSNKYVYAVTFVTCWTFALLLKFVFGK